MNKTAIKNFAIWARNKLIAEIQYKAGLLGITDKEIKNPLPQSTLAVQFFDIGTKEPYSITGVEISQRRKLAEEIRNKTDQSDYVTAYKAVIEEVAYTWFNRLVAVRFMEVNDYLPTRIRVLSSESAGKTEPDLVTQAQEADLDYTPYEKDRIAQLQQGNRLDELFRMLFIKQCNALNAILPALFEKTDDFTELLLNISFTDRDGVVCRLVSDIPEDDFNVSKEGQVEIIGWLYQYYNTEPKDETFALLKKNVKITKERIPAATQLFTPDWIVRYMVENSLGRLWLEGHPNDSLKSGWKYYLDEAKQEADVQAQLDKIREEYKKIRPEEIKVIDPCMGSGHILVYAFDVLMQIYESCGYSQRDAARSIVENNLYGLDIDQRAYQLAYFAVMMKARQYNRRVLIEGIRCNLYAIEESNGINREQLQYFGQGMDPLARNVALTQMKYLLDTMQDASEYGSIINVEPLDWPLLREFSASAEFHGQMMLDAIGLEETKERVQLLVEIGTTLAWKYDVVVTNPPYMGNMPIKMTEFVRIYYANAKYDLYSVFMAKCNFMTRKNGYLSIISQHTWMFLSSFEQFRRNVLSNDIINIVHLGTKAFEAIGGEVVQTAAFAFSKRNIKNYLLTAARLVEVDSAQGKENEFLKMQNQYTFNSSDFVKLPGMPIVYWLSHNYILAFDKAKTIETYVNRKAGLVTGNDDYFLRFWTEVMSGDIVFLPNESDEYGKYHVMSKGGSHRRYYGNYEYIIKLRDLWNPSMTNASVRRGDADFYFKKAIGWSLIGNTQKSFRMINYSVCGTASPTIYPESDKQYLYILAFLNTKIACEFLTAYNPTINLLVTDICNLPLIIAENKMAKINCLTDEAIQISRGDWDAFEISWDFKKHPLLCGAGKLAEAFDQWQHFTESQFVQLKANEEELNRIFIDIYGLQDELTPEVEDKEVTIRRADLGRDTRSFLSYAVGCMFGRYSLDVDGLAYAGGEWDGSKYSTFIPDKDNILPITDEEYFEDDIVGLFVAFVKKVYGAATLEENLDFIANALGNKGNSSREVIRQYFLKDFFKNHCQIYQKRPIYWLFDSGKADGFKALVYLHRYDANTVGKLRIDYLHRMQRIYESEIVRMQETINNSKDAREVAAATKRKEKLVKQLQETKVYDEKIAHLALARIEIDLDDGVVVNYEKLQTGADSRKLEVLAKI